MDLMQNIYLARIEADLPQDLPWQGRIVVYIYYCD